MSPATFVAQKPLCWPFPLLGPPPGPQLHSGGPSSFLKICAEGAFGGGGLRCKLPPGSSLVAQLRLCGPFRVFGPPPGPQSHVGPWLFFLPQCERGPPPIWTKILRPRKKEKRPFRRRFPYGPWANCLNPDTWRCFGRSWALHRTALWRPNGGPPVCARGRGRHKKVTLSTRTRTHARIHTHTHIHTHTQHLAGVARRVMMFPSCAVRPMRARTATCDLPRPRGAAHPSPSATTAARTSRRRPKPPEAAHLATPAALLLRFRRTVP